MTPIRPKTLACPAVVDRRYKDSLIGQVIPQGGEVWPMLPQDWQIDLFPVFMHNKRVTPDDQAEFVKNSVLYKEFLAEREEILKHKWIESEKAGSDIGFEKALLDWIVKHRSNWRQKRLREDRVPVA